MRRVRWIAVLVPLLLSGCASVEPPKLWVEGLRLGDVGINGATLDVRFRVRNPNSEPLLIERFEYELQLNGHRVGRGFEPDPVTIEPFREERVASRFDLDFFHVPGAVRDLLDEDRAQARVRGIFYVRHKGHEPERVHFDAEADVDLHHDRDRHHGQERHREHDHGDRDDNDRPPQ
jgi:LEA14-like dessication related protein